jgi:hypothetical protein
MRRRLNLLMAGLTGAVTACASPVPDGEMDASARPDRGAILGQAIECGLRRENLEFTVDSEGVDNADIFPTAPRDRRYDAAVNCMMEWAARSGAALGFEFEPRR